MLFIDVGSEYVEELDYAGGGWVHDYNIGFFFVLL